MTEEKSPRKAPESNTAAICYRAVFRVSDAAFPFSGYDEIKIPKDNTMLSDSVLRNCSFRDLCRKKSSYKRYHPDFIQTYYIDMFPKSISPCGVFIFLEKLSVSAGSFSKKPTELVSAEGRKHFSRGSDYEIFYSESTGTDLKQSRTMQEFCKAACTFLKGGAVLPGKSTVKDAGFFMAADSGCMIFVKNRSFPGFVPDLSPADTLLPLLLITGLSLGQQYSLRKLSRRLSAVLNANLHKNFTMGIFTGRYVRFFTKEYRNTACFLGETCLSGTAGFHNRNCMGLQCETEKLMMLQSEYEKIREKLEVINVTVRNLENKALLKSQSYTRWSVFFMGLSIVIAATAVSVILGAEPLIRLLIELGFVPDGFLNINR